MRRSIDASRPVMLGLIAARTLEEVAQPPPPDTEVVLGYEPTGGHWEASAGGGPWTVEFAVEVTSLDA